MEIVIPINIFAQYFEAKDSRKLTLLRQLLRSMEKQKLIKEGESNAVYGNTARAQIRSTILYSGDHRYTNKKLKEIKALKPERKWDITDQKINIRVLEKFLKMSLPESIQNSDLERINPKITTMPFYGIYIKIVPTLIFRTVINGKKKIGACMVHSSQQHPFSVAESKIVSALLYLFLSNALLEEDEEVDNELCFCLDMYAGTTIASNKFFPSDMKTIKKICADLPNNWVLAANQLAA